MALFVAILSGAAANRAKKKVRRNGSLIFLYLIVLMLELFSNYHNECISIDSNKASNIFSYYEPFT